MDYASILRVLVQIDGLAKGSSQLAAFDATQKQVAGSASSMGRDLDTAGAKTQRIAAEATKATSAARGLGDGLDRTGRSADSAGGGLNRAATGAATLHADLTTAQQASQQAAAAISGLLGDTDDYSAGLLRAHGASTQAVDSARDLHTARQTLAGQVGGLLGDEDDLASVMQRSVQVHTDAARATRDVEQATRALPGPITSVSSGFSEASLNVQKARTELDKTGTVSRSTMADLTNLGSRGVRGLDRDMDKVRATVSKAQTELANTGTISRRTSRDLEALGTAGGGAGGGIGALLGALASGGGGLSGFGLSILVLIPTIAALIGVVGALASALGPLAGLAGAAGVAVSAAGQGFGVFKLASMGVAAALREQTTQNTAAGSSALQAAQQQRTAARSIQSAMDGVRTAHEQVRAASQALRTAEDQETTAQRQLTAARTDARRALADQIASLGDARLAQISATYALQDAKTALAQLVGGPDQQKVAQASQQVTDAMHSQQAAILALGDAQRSYDQLVAGASQQQLAEATQQVTSALHSQEAAQLALTDAKQAYDALIAGPSAEDTGKAQLSLAQSQHAQQQAVMDLAAAQKTADTVNRNSRSTDAQKAKAALDLANAQDQVASANFRVTDAQQALDKVNAGPTDEDKAKALLAVQQAQDQVTDSTNAHTDAQDALDKLQAPASATDLAKALLAVQQAQDGVADATNGQLAAQQALDKLNAPVSAEDLGKAILAVDQAQQQLATSTRDRARQEKDLGTALRAGVSGSAQVLAAVKAIKQADLQAASARQQLKDATIAVDRAEQAVSDAHANAAASAARAATATGRLNTAMNGLPAPAQAFVRQLISLKPKLDELRATAAAGLFPGVSAGLTALMGNFDPIKKVVGETSTAMGDLSRKAGELVGSPAWGRDIETVGRRNAGIISIVGTAALHVADALRHVIVAAGPLTVWLARVADGWAHTLDKAAATGRENGRLAGFFDRTRRVLVLLGDITGHVADGLFNVGRAGRASGDGMLRGIDRAARRFDEWTRSDTGRNRITEFFESSRELLRNLIPVLEGVGRAVTNIGFGPMNTALRLAGSNAEALTYIFLGWKVVVGLATAATAAYEIATKGAIAAQWLWNAALTANPIGLIIVGLAALAAGLVVAYLKVKPFRDAVDETFSWIRDHWPLLTAILFGPFGIAVEQIMRHWGALTGFLSDTWATITGAATAAWDAVRNAIVTPVRAARDLLETEVLPGIVNRLGSAWATVRTGASDAWNAVKASVVGPIRSARDLLGDEVLPGIGNRLSAAWALIKAGTGAAWDTMRDYILGPTRVARDLLGNEVLPGIGNRLADAWSSAKTGTSNAWGAIRDSVLSALRGARDLLDSGENILGGITNRVTKAWSAITDGTAAFGLVIENTLARAFGRSANAVIGFINLIIRAINLIPGIPNIGTLGKVDVPDALSAGDALKQVQQHYQGGAFSHVSGSALAGGGIVDRPLIMLGEEAPRHEEWVIPTNPAYRSRALGLHAAAGKALGLAQGGVFSEREIEGVWTSAGGASSKAHTMGLIAEAESSGNRFAYNRSGASGLWQILGQVVAGNIFDPIVNAKNAIAKSSNGVNLHPWDASRSVWGPQVSSGGGGIAGAIGGAISDAIGAARDAASFISNLPGVGDLPDWLQGTGRYVLDHVGDWIRSQIGGLINSGDRATGPAGGGGLGTFDGRPVAKWIIPELEWARKHGWTGHITSGYRDPSQVVSNAQGIVAPQGQSNHNTTSYPGGAIDVGDPGARAAGQALYQSLLNYPDSRRLVWGGPVIGDWGHFSATGHAIGGILGKASGAWAGLPFGGSFGDGGIVPGALGQPVAIVAHGGERVTPAAQGTSSSDGPIVEQNFYGPVSFHDERDAIVLAREVGWEVSR